VSTTQTQLFPPPTRSQAVDEKGFLGIPLRQWLFTLQNLLPLIVVDTSAGNVTQALPPAGLNSSTGQSNQNMEITFLKSTADAHTVTVTGAQGGSQTLVAQFEFRRFKSDGTSWWLIS
jgi:hypothetical protein